MMSLSITRILRAAMWLLAGHIALGWLYWRLLNVPESNATMLALSAVLALLLVFGAGVVEANGILQVGTDWPWRERLRLALRRSGMLVTALAVWVLVSWMCGWVESWHTAHRGEIDAWFIARLDWTNMAWLHGTVRWLLRVVRYVVGTSLAVAILAAGILQGVTGVLRFRWIRAALAPIRLLTIGIIVALFFWLPWRAAWWRPAFLPPNVLEPAFGAFKLTVLAIVMHIGWALMLSRAVAPHSTPRAPAALPTERVA
jgi:hypothetical protein